MLREKTPYTEEENAAVELAALMVIDGACTLHSQVKALLGDTCKRRTFESVRSAIRKEVERQKTKQTR